MSNVVDVVVRRLRLKLREPELILTVRGRGYRLATR
jgi:DNA-binding response OmpR family regulator